LILGLSLNGCRLWDALFGSSFDSSAGRTIWTVENHVNSSKPFFDDSAAYFLGNEHQVTAVDKRTGRVRWSVVLPVNFSNTIGFGGVIADGKVIIGDADVFALDPADGRLIWRFTPVEGKNPGITFLSRWNGLVLSGSTSGHVFAINARDGTQAWARQLVPRTNVRVFSPVVAGDAVFAGFGDTEIAANGETQGGLAALDAATGAVRWLTYLPHNVDALSPTAPLDPALAGSVVAVGVRDGPVYAYDRASGELRWKSPALLTPGAATEAQIRDLRPVCGAGGFVYAGSTAEVLVAIDAETGETKWRASSSQGSFTTFLSCEENAVYGIHPGGQIDVYDGRTGRVKWTQDDFGRYAVGVGIDADRVYMGALHGLYALRKN
jgi:outer membrane protein assembly factor BamB